ncbi:MAG TPA: LuxR family transcriptional regulator [Magnetovibrio sp.]
MSLGRFIEESLKLDDPAELFSLYLNALAEYGVDRVMYSALRNTPHNESAVPSISHSYPEDWIAFYMANDYVRLDPVRQHGMSTRHAFMWSDMARFRDLTPAQITLMKQGEEAGLKNGLAIAFHGPLGEVYGVGMASSQPNPGVENHLQHIQVLSTQFHVLFTGLHDQSKMAVGASLTPREMEVLRWCAAGKSNWSIGEILGISEHGVDFHMRNILRKLEADTRMTAVVKALHGGLVSI